MSETLHAVPPTCLPLQRSLQQVPHSGSSQDRHSGEACQLNQRAETTFACCRPTANDLGTARSPAPSATAGPQLQQPLPNPPIQLGQLLLSAHHASSPAARQQQAQWHLTSQLERRLCQSHVSQQSAVKFQEHTLQPEVPIVPAIQPLACEDQSAGRESHRSRIITARGPAPGVACQGLAACCRYLTLQMNQLSGSLPGQWAPDAFFKLQVIGLQENQLEGSLPASWTDPDAFSSIRGPLDGM